MSFYLWLQQYDLFCSTHRQRAQIGLLNGEMLLRVAHVGWQNYSTESLRTKRRGSLDISYSECLLSACQQNIDDRRYRVRFLLACIPEKYSLRGTHDASLHCKSSIAKHRWYCGIVGALWTTLLISSATCLQLVYGHSTGNPNDVVPTVPSFLFVGFRAVILSMKPYYSDRLFLRVCGQILG